MIVTRVKRDVFIKERRRAINEAKRHPDLIIVDPGDMCVCDTCNVEVLDEVLNIHDEQDLLCSSCSEAAEGDHYARYN